MTTINKYCKHDVVIVKTTLLKGRETTSEVEAKGCNVGTIRVAVRDVSGTHIEEKTVVMLKPDADVNRGDKIKIDDVTMAISKITRPAFVGKPPNHIEVTLD
ncbi:unnamed protein product [marine sediment metagenome]|uniref:Uncharacterized protein n=1 Tax=marine sediment metagenome TaxID=412755 RepID=X1C6D8_9ZZZZ